MVKSGQVEDEGAFETHLTREIDFNGLDANVLGSRCHVGR